MGKPICPFCHVQIEDWKHVIWCNHAGQATLCERFIQDFSDTLDTYNTYPPLAEFMVEFITDCHFDLEEPLIGRARYCLPFYFVFHSQKQVGWDNFSHGIVFEVFNN